MNSGKILLALDPFEDAILFNEESLKELRYWAKNMATSVEAVYVLTQKADQPQTESAQAAAADGLEVAVKKLNLGVPVNSKILLNYSTSRRDSVKTLVYYAERENVDLILVSSHGRQGVSRMVLGSFAETLLSDSPKPVLFLGARPSESFSVDKILYPTDFSDESLKGFQALLKQMKILKPSLLLYHAIPQLSLFHDYSLTGVGAYLPESFWKTQKEMIIRRAEVWAELARKEGYTVRVRIDDVSATDIPKLVNQAADEEEVAMIALTAPKIGNISKEIFRNRKHGVWVFGPTAVENVLEDPSHAGRFKINVDPSPRTLRT